MTDRYKLLEGYEHAQQFINQLKQLGVSDEDMHIVISQDSNVDSSVDTLMNKDVTVDQAPSGTINAFSATFVTLATLASGAAFLASGPIAAGVAGAAVAGGGLTALFSGTGVPEEKQDELISHLEAGHVFVHVKSDDPKITELFR